MVPPWIRVQRIQMDIPVNFIEAGCKRSDVRNLIEEKLKERSIKTMEIRSREVGFELMPHSTELNLVRRDYEAGYGKEIFLSYEDSEGHIAGYLRLRKPSDRHHRGEMNGSSVVREIKVLGEAVHIGDRPDDRWQHRGLGRQLISQAEEISRSEWGMDRILVISGIGVREYFRKLGYFNVGPYVGKTLLSGGVN